MSGDSAICFGIIMADQVTIVRWQISLNFKIVNATKLRTDYDMPIILKTSQQCSNKLGNSVV